MAGMEAMGRRVRRKIRDDGVVVDVREPVGGVEVEGGQVESLSPPLVKLRTGETVGVDAYLAGSAPRVGDVVAVARRGAFVLVLGKVVLL